MTKEEEEQSPTRSLFNCDVDGRRNTMRQVVVGGEKMAKEDNDGSWKKPATTGWGKDAKQRGTERQHAASSMLREGKCSISCLVRA